VQRVLLLNILIPQDLLNQIRDKLKSPYDTITIQGSDMPIYGTRTYGDLKIAFKVLFPTQIPPHLIEDTNGLLSALDSWIHEVITPIR